MELLGESDLDELEKDGFSVDEEMGPNSMRKNDRRPLISRNQDLKHLTEETAHINKEIVDKGGPQYNKM